MKRILLTLLTCAIALGASAQNTIGQTSVTRWPDGKRGAVSITWDDGSINQFRIGIPLLDRYELPATYYITTSAIEGSTREARFIGRPVEEIVAETASVPTNADNMLERAGAIQFVNVRGAFGEATSVGAQFDARRLDRAREMIDDFYARVRSGELAPTEGRVPDPSTRGAIDWDQIRKLVSRGHEFSSHMLTHPYMSALDEANMLYELNESRAEILEQLGKRETLVGEMPYDTNDARAMEYMEPVFPVGRSRTWFTKTMESHQPGWAQLADSDKEYVQSRRTVYTRTTLDELKGWVDEALAADNIWFVPVHHGIDGIGWESMTSEDLDAYLSYIASNQDKLWVATYGDAARYVKERMTASVSSARRGRTIEVEVDHPLDKELYDLPLTLRTLVDPAWQSAEVSQRGDKVTVPVTRDADGAWITYNAVPGGGKITIKRQ